MQKRFLLALALIAAIGLLSAQQGPACPYAHRAASSARSEVTALSNAPAEGSFFSVGRSAIFAP